MFFWFLLLLFLVFVLRPVWRFWRTLRRVQKEQQRIYSELFGNGNPDGNPRRSRASWGRQQQEPQEQQEQQDLRGGWTRPRPRRKKIDPSVGTYIKFKETPDRAEGASGASSSASAYFRTEEQVSDISFTDL